jgi:hypothetical protein
MTLDTAKAITRYLVLGTGIAVPSIWIIWDLYAYFMFGRDATESHYLYEGSQSDPWIFLGIFIAVALLAWHLFVGPENVTAMVGMRPRP